VPRGRIPRPSRAGLRPVRLRARHDTGQSLVEFALILPLLLLLTLIALDFGRVYLGWINLQNMARIAANFAANHPDAWLAGDTATITQYQNQILADASATNCALTPKTPDSPTFTDMNGDGVTIGLGDHATVTLSCRFKVITPVVSSILGGTVAVTASAVFPVKSGLSGDMGGVAWACLKPSAAINANPPDGLAPLTVHFTDASGGGAADSWVWDFGDGPVPTWSAWSSRTSAGRTRPTPARPSR
jgi:Flp pilus assembly protein TadG